MRQSLARRFVFPVALVAGIMVVSSLLYDQSRSLQFPTLHRILANAGAAGLFVSIWLGAFIAHPIAFFRGAGYGERLLAALATPVFWSATVLVRFIGIYSPGEFAFLFLHHLVLGAPVVALLGMAISEMVCRAVLRRHTGDRSIRILDGRSVTALVAGLALVTTMLWKGGHTYYYWYMDLYTKLFL
jgi:hypothetical protein